MGLNRRIAPAWETNPAGLTESSSRRLTLSSSKMFLGRIWSGVFEKKLGAIVDRMRSDQTFLSPVRYRLYGNTARPGHLRDRKETAFAKAVESALQSISLSNVAD